MDVYKILVVGGGGFFGSVGRYLTVKFVDARVASLLPYGTLVVNMLGSFFLGLLYAAALKYTGLTENWRLFLGAGFCGGFTTFSAFAFENFDLLQQKYYAVSLTYMVASLMMGLAALGVGIWCGRFM